MTPFENKIFRFCEAEKLFENCTGAVLAVSGGPDSMALLRFFVKNREKFAFPILCATVDHRIRIESADELRAVAEFCEKNGVVFEGKSVNIPETCPKNVSTETYARTVRYSFFDELREKYGYSHVVTAHTSDDNVETVLMNIIRGTSVSGLCGIPPLRDDLVARPLLRCEKSELISYCESEGVEFFTDKTNEENIYRRNVVRNVIIPLLEKENPAVKKAINRLSAAAATDEEFLSSETEEVLTLTEISEKKAKIPLSLFAERPKAVMTRVIRSVFFSLSGKELSYDMTESVYLLYLQKSTSASVRLFEYVARRNYDCIELFLPEREKTEVLQINAKVNTEIPFFDGIVKIIKREASEKRNSNSVFLEDCDGLILRNRKQGDVFSNTKNGSKPLRRMYIDKKIPSDIRDRLPVLEKNGEIYWGAEIGAAYKHRAAKNGDFYEIIFEKQEGKKL